jgi:hypothetical protein
MQIFVHERLGRLDPDMGAADAKALEKTGLV